jgi:microcystin-dependent protein
MPSPITGDDIPKISGSMEPCDVMSALLESVEKLTMLVEGLYDDEGLPTLVHAREIAAISFPQGCMMQFHFSSGTSLTEVTRTIETIWLTEEEIDSYDSRDPAVKASVRPFWVIANAENTQGGPDVSGRFLLAADYGLEEDSPSGLTGIAPPGGDKEIILSVDEMPIHDHEVIVGGAKGTIADPDTGRFLFSPKKERIQEGVGTPDSSSKAYPELELGLKMGGGKAHPNMPPYFVVIVAYRTGRMS